jgi:hypothetical protein
LKTSVSLPESTFEEAERLAKYLGLSRSELYRQALYHYLRLHSDKAMTEAFNRFFDENPQETDPFVRAAARKVFEANEW